MHDGDVLPDAVVFLFEFFENEVRVRAAEPFEDVPDGRYGSAGTETGDESDEQADAVGYAVDEHGRVESHETDFRRSCRNFGNDFFRSAHNLGIWKNKNRLSVRRGGPEVLVWI